MTVVLIVIILILGIIIISMNKNKRQSNKTNETKGEIEVEEKTGTIEMPYKKKYLLTKNEWYFYKGLKPVADELGYTILAKIRVADLIEVVAKDPKEKMAYTNKVNRKHIDFALARPENLKIELLIELDDMSHNTKQKDRDEFIEKLYEKTGYKLLRTEGTGGLKEKIENILKPEETKQEILSENVTACATAQEIKSKQE